MHEAHVFGRQAHVHEARDIVPAGRDIELRHAMVGRRNRCQRVLQRLEALHAQLRAIGREPEAAAVGDIGVLLQVADRGLAHLARKIDEIAVVGHPVEVDVQAHSWQHRLRVIPRDAVALPPELGIFGHVFQPELASVSGIDVAAFISQESAALGHVRRRDRGVVFGRDVPVVRDAGLEAARAAVRVVRRQQAALALVLEGKAGKGRPEDRGVEEAQPRALR